MELKDLLIDFSHDITFTKNDFRISIQKRCPDCSERKITYLLSKMRSERLIMQVGYGKYRLFSCADVKSNYTYNHSNEYKKIEMEIYENYPYVDFQIWELIQLNEFINHQIAKNVFIIEVEPMLVDAVFDLLHKQYPYALFSPSIEQYYRQKGIENDIVVLKLISEAPSMLPDHSCCIEKIMVDLFSNKFTGNLIEHSEYPMILEEIFRKYIIDENKLFRYAKRRNLDKRILEFIQNDTDISLLTR